MLLAGYIEKSMHCERGNCPNCPVKGYGFLGLLGFGSGKEIERLQRENAALRKSNRRLVDLSDEKDACFLEMISDGLRHGSSLAGKHMAYKKKYLRGKQCNESAVRNEAAPCPESWIGGRSRLLGQGWAALSDAHVVVLPD